MEPPKNSMQKALGLIGGAVLIVLVAGVGLYTFLTTMGTALHPEPAAVPSVRLADPSQEWAAVVQQAQQLARAALAHQNLPGLSVAVGVGGHLVWAEGFGWADLEKRVPVAPTTRFRVGHASNAMTSAAVGLLLERGRLDLDNAIQSYVPAFPEKQWTVTLRQLMGHVSGVRHYDREADYMPTAHCDRASEGLRAFADDPLRFQPETQSAYSAFGWMLVSAAVEAAANESFFTFMRSQIFQPLGMRHTTSDAVAEALEDRAAFYYPRFSGDPSYGPEPATDVDYSCFAGAGGFLSTPSDLVRFGMALNGHLRQGFGAQGGTLLKPATVAMLQTPQQLLSGEETEFGLGWTVETFPLAGEPTRLASQASRTLLGGSTSFMTFPDRGIVVVAMSNTSFADLRLTGLNIATAVAERRPE